MKRSVKQDSPELEDQFKGDNHKNVKSDPSVVLPKKKSGSAAMQIMKAVTKLAINPPRKKVSKLANGPSSQNSPKQNRQDLPEKSRNAKNEK